MWKHYFSFAVFLIRICEKLTATLRLKFIIIIFQEKVRAYEESFEEHNYTNFMQFIIKEESVFNRKINKYWNAAFSLALTDSSN